MITVAKGYRKIEKLFRKSERLYNIGIGTGASPKQYDDHLEAFSEENLNEILHGIGDDYCIQINIHPKRRISLLNINNTFENINLEAGDKKQSSLT